MRARVVWVAGVVMVVVGLAADVLGGSSEPGIGSLQLGLIGLGAALLLWCALGRWPRAQGLLSRVLIMVVSTYLALWAAELLMTYVFNPARNFRPHVLSLRGMYEVGERGAYRHVAGYSGVFDDGVLRIPIRINSRGDRDDEPREDHPVEDRLLLVGDSFTFGQGLRDEERIDRRIEHHSGGQVDAYNLGVMGYGPGSSLLRLEESSWWEGRAVYYLFFENDLADIDARPDYYTVYDGFVVPRADPEGEPYTPEQWAKLLSDAREQGGRNKGSLGLSLTLPRLRKIAHQVTHKNNRLTGIPERLVRPANIDAAVDTTTQLQALARARGASFTVVLVPAVGEATAGEYSDWGRAYVDGITARGIDVLDVLERFDGDDYFDHDPHFDPGGADIMATAILEHFRRSAPPSSS